MSTPVIMTVAITGAVPTKTDKQAVPLTPLEPIEAAWAAYKQGASLVDIHVRNDDKTPSSDPHAARTLETRTILELPVLKLRVAARGKP